MSAPPPKGFSTLGVHLLRLGLSVGVVSLGALLPAASVDLGFAVQEGKQSFLAFAVGFLVGLALVRGPLWKWDNFRISLLSCAGFCVAMVLWGMAQSLGWLIGAFFLFGAMASMQEISANALLVRLDPEDATRSLALMHSTFCIGALGAPLVAGWFIGMGQPWRLVPLGNLIFCGAGTLVFAVLVRRRVVERPLPTDAAPPRGDRRPWPILLGIMVVVYLATEMSMNHWAPAAMKHRFALTEDRAAALISWFWGMMWVGRMALGWASRRLSALTLLLGAVVCSAVANGVLLVAGSLPVALGALWLVGFFLSPVLPLSVAVGSTLVPRRLEETNMFIFLCVGLGLLLGPPLVGQVADVWGLPAVFVSSVVLNVALAAAGLAFWWWARGLERTA